MSEQTAQSLLRALVEAYDDREAEAAKCASTGRARSSVPDVRLIRRLEKARAFLGLPACP